jgi:hypothetical protein
VRSGAGSLGRKPYNFTYALLVVGYIPQAEMVIRVAGWTHALSSARMLP